VTERLRSPTECSLEFKRRAQALGFDLVGIASAPPPPEIRFLREWLDHGYAGEMDYIARRVAERSDPRAVLDGAQTVIVAGLVYASGARPEAVPGQGRVARYAGGADYHETMKRPLQALAGELAAIAGRPVCTRVYVDTGPVQERLYVAYAGLGWIGKNGCLINRTLGSYILLGVILTDLDLVVDGLASAHCGTCTACIDACPTGAIVEPGVVDARRCISYTTIEQRGPIPFELRAAHGAHVFGCDICQEVCPWNGPKLRGLPEGLPQDRGGLRAQLQPKRTWRNPSLSWLLALEDASWREVTANTALRRTKWQGLLRNALVAAGNSGDRSLLPQLERLVDHPNPVLAEHARWALERLETVSHDEG